MQEYTFNKGKDHYTIGRRETNDIILVSDNVSREHGLFQIAGSQIVYSDRNSTNGTTVERDGRKNYLFQNTKGFKLQNGDLIRIQSNTQKNGKAIVMLFTDKNSQGTWQCVSAQNVLITIGRNKKNSIVLTHPAVSRIHAEIENRGGQIWITDHHSANGTMVNGHTIRQSYPLQEKDVIRILDSMLIYSAGNVFYRTSVNGIAIDVTQVNKYVGKKKKKILDDVNCTIESNEFVAIVGGSGAGKSTLMNVINGFDKKAKGNIAFNGIDLRSHFNELKTLIGYVPQEDIVYENLTLRKMLYYTANLKMPGDTSKQEIEKQIDHVLDMVDLKEHQKTLIRKMSGGQKKRASIAVEMLANPSVFFLDEPTSGLDPGTEQKLMRTLNKLSKTQGKTIIMVTHTTKSLHLCDKVIFMGQGGRLCFCGTVDQAKMFFNTDDLVDIYNMISSEPKLWAEQYRNCMQFNQQHAENPQQEMSKKGRQNYFKQFGMLTLRYMELIVNDLPRLLMLLMQPILIALLLAIVANENVFKTFEDTKSILFSLSCAAIWIGLFNSIQEICKERNILKREYMGNLKLPLYTLSKFMVQTLLALIQALLMTAVFAVTIGQPEQGVFFDAAFLEMMLTVWLTIEASMAMGFVVSALVKSGDKAMTVAPFLLIIQLLFSGILFEMKGMGEKISYLTVSKWSVEGLCSIADLNSLKSQMEIPGAPAREIFDAFKATKGHVTHIWLILFGMMLLYAIVCTLVLKNVANDGR